MSEQSNTSGSLQFYKTLAEHYDKFFPVEPTVISYLQAHGAQPGNRVLDVACGTGGYALALLEQDVDVIGLDISPDLLSLTRLRTPQPDRFIHADMLDARAYPDGPFDLAYCIGNSIAHLPTWNAVGSMINTLAELPCHAVVIQFVEMSSIDVGTTRTLPDLNAEGIRFMRTYERHTATRMTFHGRIEPDAAEVRNELLVIHEHELIQTLKDAGLGRVDVAGGFSGQPTHDSWVRVVYATA